MTELEEIKQEILIIKEELRFVKVLHNIPKNAVVGTDFVAALWGISEESVRRGRFGTNEIPRARENPIGFRLPDVLRVHKKQFRPKTEKELAAEYCANARKVTRKKSILEK